MNIRLFFILLLCIGVNAFALNIPDKPNSRVIDQTRTLSARQQQILVNTLDNIYATESHTEIQILLVKSLGDEPIEQVTLDVARKWKIGQKNTNNGALILVAVADHKYRIEVGYGLEGLLPDGYIGNLERNVISPNFAKNDFFTGLNLALTDIKRQIATEYKKAASHPDNGQLSTKSAVIYVLLGVGIFVVIAILGIASGRPGLVTSILWFLLKIITLAAIFRGGGGGNNRNDDDIGGGGDFGGGGSSNKW